MKKKHWVTICNGLYICPTCKSSSRNKNNICKGCGTLMFSNTEEQQIAIEKSSKEPISYSSSYAFPKNYY